MEAVNQWADATTCHGVRDVHKSSSLCGKICWSLIVAVFLIIMALQLLDTERMFSEHRWITTVYEESSNGIDVFPTITVCSYNRLQASAVLKHNLTEDNLIYLFHNMPPKKQLSVNSYFNASIRAEQTALFIQWKQQHNMTMRDIFREMSPTCDETFEYIGSSFFSANNCTPSDLVNITPVFTADFGQCYQVNIQLQKKINYPGKKFALSMLLNAHMKDYLNFSIANYLDQGFALQFHYGRKVIESQWLSVAPGFHFMVGLRQRENRVKLPSMHSFGSNIWEMIFSQPLLATKPPCTLTPKLKYQSHDYYSREHCLVECLVQPFVDLCGCISFIDSPTVPMCEPEEFEDCVKIISQLNSFKDFDDECAKACPEPCFDKRIETSVSFTGFPPKNQVASLQKLLKPGKSQSLEEVWEDYVSIDIYFEKISVTVVEMYESFTLEDLVSNLGGVMSLWAGMSILTIVQGAVYLLYGLACSIGLVKKKLIKKVDKVEMNGNMSKGIMNFAKNDRLSVVDLVRPKLIRSARLRSSSDA
uniref:Uncharacterized protein n=1 Tax=Plectus sambesii TaxID=2011161 RepID=A0A914W120_9BILA